MSKGKALYFANSLLITITAIEVGVIFLMKEKTYGGIFFLMLGVICWLDNILEIAQGENSKRNKVMETFETSKMTWLSLLITGRILGIITYFSIVLMYRHKNKQDKDTFNKTQKEGNISEAITVE